MSDSLKDQLIALGLAKQEQRQRRKKPVRKQDSRKTGEMSLDLAYRLRDKQEKESAQARSEEKRALDLERKRINRKIHEIVDSHKLNDPKAEIKRNFMFKGRIRSVLCTADQLRALNEGELGVVFLRGSYYLVLPEHLEAVRGISPDHVPDLGGSECDVDGEDERYKVPDDLVW